MKKQIILTVAILLSMSANAQKHCNLIVGTYTNACKSDGIYVYDFDGGTADTKPKASTKKVINPSFLAVSPDNKKIYSVNENGKESTVSAFHFNAKSGLVDFQNRQSSEGADPCYIINDTKNAIVANYSGGSISVFGKNSDGSLAKARQVVQHEGHSVNKKRQESPHVHMVQFSPDRQFVLANDLGTDRIYLYSYSPDAEQPLQFKDTIATKTGGGPRHLAFSPNGKFVYLLQELDGTLTVFSYDNAKFRRIQETTIVTQDFTGETSAADIHISGDGKFLYATNRGEANTISVFSVDSKGRLAHRQTIPTEGKGPRNFAIDPSGNYVLVGHQYSNNIVIFKRDAVTGMLADTGKRIELCAPVCLIFTEE